MFEAYWGPFGAILGRLGLIGRSLGRCVGPGARWGALGMAGHVGAHWGAPGGKGGEEGI